MYKDAVNAQAQKVAVNGLYSTQRPIKVEYHRNLSRELYCIIVIKSLNDTKLVREMVRELLREGGGGPANTLEGKYPEQLRLEERVDRDLKKIINKDKRKALQLRRKNSIMEWLRLQGTSGSHLVQHSHSSRNT